jgi:hypothetical protein
MSTRVVLTQKQRVLKLLRAGRKLTQAQAREKFGIMSLSSRVNELRHDGVSITATPYRQKDRPTVVKYHLAA